MNFIVTKEPATPGDYYFVTDSLTIEDHTLVLVFTYLRNKWDFLEASYWVVS